MVFEIKAVFHGTAGNRSLPVQSANFPKSRLYMLELRLSPWLLCLSLVLPAAFPQTLPQIQPDGVVNAASCAQPIAPGSIIAIFGTNLASTETKGSGYVFGGLSLQ